MKCGFFYVWGESGQIQSGNDKVIYKRDSDAKMIQAACEFLKTGDAAAVYIILILVLGGLFIPMITVARKYEYAPDNPRPAHVNRKDWIWICGCVIAVVIFVVILRSGVAPTGSGLQMGWVESNTRDHWSATYAFHDGYQQRTINTDGEATVLEVEIVSSSGEIGMTVTDENGNVIYDQQGIETSSFEIEISGKVTVKITGEDHKGSFSLSW